MSKRNTRKYAEVVKVVWLKQKSCIKDYLQSAYSLGAMYISASVYQQPFIYAGSSSSLSPFSSHITPLLFHFTFKTHLSTNPSHHRSLTPFTTMTFPLNIFLFQFYVLINFHFNVYCGRLSTRLTSL